MKQISSPNNAAVRAARKLGRGPARRAAGAFLVEGARGIRAAVAAGVRLRTLLVTEAGAAGDPDLIAAAERLGTRVLVVPGAVLASVSQTVAPQELIAVAPRVVAGLDGLPAAPRLVCVLAGVRDPGNLGTVLRTADAFAADALATTAGSVDPENPKAVRAAAGSLFHLPVLAGVRWPALRDALRGQGLALVGLDAHAPAGVDAAPLERPAALVLGSEAHGLPAVLRADLDAVVRLPTRGRAESLNLAAAAAVALYEAARRQHGSAAGAPPAFAAPAFAAPPVAGAPPAAGVALLEETAVG